MEKKQSKKWIIHTVAFLMVFVTIFVWTSYLFRPASRNRKNIVGFYSEPRNTLDVVLIGGSSTFVFWEPYEAWHDYGIVSYNFATNSMSPALLKNMIVEAENYQSPELYVIDLRAFDMRERHPDFYTEGYLRNITDSLKYSANRMDMIRYSYAYESGETRDAPASYIDLILYHSRWQELDQDSYQYAFNNIAEENKGFELHPKTYHEALEPIDITGVDEVQPLSEDSNQILVELLEYCKREELNVLFTLNPYKIEDAETKARYNYIEQVIRGYGYDFVDANEYYNEMALDFSRDFYDEAHVNILGAEKYTGFLGKYIKEHFAVSDRRGDQDYASWEAGYPAWQERAAAHKAKVLQSIAEHESADNGNISGA